MASLQSVIVFAFIAVCYISAILTEAKPMDDKVIDKMMKKPIVDEMDASSPVEDKEEDIKGAESAYSPFYPGYPYYSPYSLYSPYYKPYLSYPYHYPYVVVG